MWHRLTNFWFGPWYQQAVVVLAALILAWVVIIVAAWIPYLVIAAIVLGAIWLLIRFFTRH